MKKFFLNLVAVVAVVLTAYSCSCNQCSKCNEPCQKDSIEAPEFDPMMQTLIDSLGLDAEKATIFADIFDNNMAKMREARKNNYPQDSIIKYRTQLDRELARLLSDEQLNKLKSLAPNRSRMGGHKAPCCKKNGGEKCCKDSASCPMKNLSEAQLDSIDAVEAESFSPTATMTMPSVQLTPDQQKALKEMLDGARAKAEEIKQLPRAERRAARQALQQECEDFLFGLLDAEQLDAISTK
ncbi:MAG: hypothetical protein HUJ96_08225 [Marinilabiliaceae bacterium]|nr:hypothetical protein [Marinilabiliaceae bacterium]